MEGTKVGVHNSSPQPSVTTARYAPSHRRPAAISHGRVKIKVVGANYWRAEVTRVRLDGKTQHNDIRLHDLLALIAVELGRPAPAAGVERDRNSRRGVKPRSNNRRGDANQASDLHSILQRKDCERVGVRGVINVVSVFVWRDDVIQRQRRTRRCAWVIERKLAHPELSNALEKRPPCALQPPARIILHRPPELPRCKCYV